MARSRRRPFLLAAILGIMLASSSDISAQDADSYEPHPEGQFAGMTGHDMLAASDRAAADARDAAEKGDWLEAYGSYHWAQRFRHYVYQGTHPDEFDMEHALGETAIQSGFFVYAKRHYESAFQNRTKLIGPSHPDTLVSLTGYAGVLIEIGLPDRALSILSPAVGRAKDALGPDHPVTIDLLQQYGRALMQLNRVYEAEQTFALVLAERERLDTGNEIAIAIGAADLANALAVRNRYNAAKPYAELAVKTLAEKHGVRRTDVARSQASLGAVLLGLDEAESAEVHFRSAIAALDGTGADLPLRKRINQRLGLALLRQPAKRHLALGPLQATATDQSQIGGFKHENGNHAVHRLLIDAYFAKADEAGASMDALELADHSPGVFRSMLQSFDNSADRAIVSAIGRSASGASGELVRTRERLLIEREELQAEYAAAQGDGGAESEKFRIALIHNGDAIRRNEDGIRKIFPEYFDFLESKTIDIDTPYELLRPGEALLMVVPTEISTQILYYANGHHVWKRTSATPEEINSAVRRLLWDVGAPNNASPAEIVSWMDEMADKGAYPYSFAQAKFLYDQLFSGLDRDDVDHVFVVADGPLASLPLGLLVDEIPQGRTGDPKTLRSASWLSNQLSFSVLPSLQTLFFLRKHRAGDKHATRNKFIGIGDPILDGDANTRGGSAQRRGSGNHAPSLRNVFRTGGIGTDETKIALDELRSLARLPGTAEELTNLSQIFGTPDNSLYLSDRATETNVKSRRLDADVLAFATHGLLAGEINGAIEPGLVLTPPAVATSNDDGYLAMSEIASLDLDAEWVILSACNTAAGDGSSGAAGLSGLARAFFFAGAENLLVSHWPVRDAVAARMTVRTVELTTGKSPLTRASALQQAMKEIRDDPSRDSAADSWAHPNAWAPFSLVGDGSAK
jgi:CHAT domain-containing protein/tetratricopeptide (TPR) repeat protein